MIFFYSATWQTDSPNELKESKETLFWGFTPYYKKWISTSEDSSVKPFSKKAFDSNYKNREVRAESP
jgi:hypothetical protein